MRPTNKQDEGGSASKFTKTCSKPCLKSFHVSSSSLDVWRLYIWINPLKVRFPCRSAFFISILLPVRRTRQNRLQHRYRHAHSRHSLKTSWFLQSIARYMSDRWRSRLCEDVPGLPVRLAHLYRGQNDPVPLVVWHSSQCYRVQTGKTRLKSVMPKPRFYFIFARTGFRVAYFLKMFNRTCSNLSVTASSSSRSSALFWDIVSIRSTGKFSQIWWW